MPILYRIEHPEDGEGHFAYRCSNFNEDTGEYDYEILPVDVISPSCYKRHEEMPLVDEEFEKWTGSYYCAYLSLEDLLYWVTPEELRLLAEAGYRAYRLELRDAIIGDTQAIFLKEDVTRQGDITDEILN